MSDLGGDLSDAMFLPHSRVGVIRSLERRLVRHRGLGGKLVRHCRLGGGDLSDALDLREGLSNDVFLPHSGGRICPMTWCT